MDRLALHWRAYHIVLSCSATFRLAVVTDEQLTINFPPLSCLQSKWCIFSTGSIKVPCLYFSCILTQTYKSSVDKKRANINLYFIFFLSAEHWHTTELLLRVLPNCPVIHSLGVLIGLNNKEI